MKLISIQSRGDRIIIITRPNAMEPLQMTVKQITPEGHKIIHQKAFSRKDVALATAEQWLSEANQ